MSSTQAEAAVMEQVATKFDDAHQFLRTTLSTLMREVEAMRPHWQGRGAISFDNVSVAWAKDQSRLLQALSETAQAVRTAGRDYTAVDDVVSDRMRTAPIQLPL